MAVPHRTSALPLFEHATRDFLMIILLADTPLPPVKSVYGDYHDIFTALFKNALDKQSAHGSHKLTIESYDAVQMAYPTEDRLKQADVVLITGSASSAYNEIAWIEKLVKFTASIQTLSPRTKIIGICFGHQIVARAFGKYVEKNSKGWEIGTRELDLTPLGKRVLGDSIAVHQMHQDHVPELPEGFESLGSTPICPVHGMAKLDDKSNPVIITLQGHPEFTQDIVEKIIDIREKGSIISAGVAQASRRHAAEHDDGVRIGQTLLQWMMVQPSS